MCYNRAMRFDVFTLFPAIFESPLEESILKRAIEANLIDIRLHNIRDYARDKHHVTDDTPYGGGGGMVMKPEPIFAAVESILETEYSSPIILLTPQGRLFNHAIARELAAHDRIALICGRYEGVDERVREHLATDELSIGDYVLTGGELPALVVIDAVSRLRRGVLGDPHATADDSHSMGLLEYPHYTRPADFRGWKVPDVLASGHHAEIERWRRQQALLRTWRQRADLFEKAPLSEEDRQFIESQSSKDV